MKKKYILIGSIVGAICSITIIVLLCFFMIPRISYGYDSKTDTYYVDTVYGNAKSYAIAEQIDGKPVTKIKSRAFMNKTNLEVITFSESLKEIERLSFKGCTNLQSISLEHIEVLGRNAFEGCSSLEEISLTLKNIPGGCFMDCSSLKEVELKNTKSIGSYAFAGVAIEEIVLPESCTELGTDAFYACSKLAKIVVYSPYLVTNSYLMSLKNVVFM